MTRPGMVLIVLMLSTSLAFGATPKAAPSSSISTTNYDVPSYTQSKLPSISSCDAKAKPGDLDELPSTGNGYMDAVTSTAIKLNKAYGNKDDGESSSSSDEEDVDGKATLDTDCERTKDSGAADKLGIDKEGLKCPIKEDYLASLKEKRDASHKYLACKRGVLDALRGEIGCFKKQIADAEGYMNELVNGPGGLAGMLQQGTEALTQIDNEVMDRQAQLDEANSRIEGGEGGNPPGLRQARDKITELSTKLPARVTQVNQQVENLRNQQSRFNTLVDQLSMARAMECMNTPVAGYRCVKSGTSSSKYPAGAVSPLDYLKCIYAQSANKLVGGQVVKNAAREDAYLKAASDAFAQAATRTPSATQLPDFSDQKAFSASMKVYPVKTPADLEKLLAGTLGQMEATTGKSMSAQFKADLGRCYAAAKKEVADERKDSNSQIKATETAMRQSFESTRSANAGAFRELRDTYAQAVKAATGQSLNIDTSKCETAGLEDQAKCFDALNSMTDALLTGKVPPTVSTLTGPALALTGGNLPISQFKGGLPAKNNPARSLVVNCAGVDDCLTRYTNIRTQLKQVVAERKVFKTNFANQVNGRLLTTAKDLAAKGVTGAGQAGIQPGMITLNTVAGNVAKRKTQLETAMSKLGVDMGLDLDPKEIKEPGKDENGLYKPSDLKNLVLAEVTPALPDNNSKGFSDTTKAIGEKDTKLSDLQDALETDYAAAENKAKECKSTGETKLCDRKSKDLEECYKRGESSLLYQQCLALTKVLGSDLSGKETKIDASASLKKLDCSSSELECGVQTAEKKKYCEYGDAVTNVEDEGNQATGEGRKGDSQKAGVSN